MIRFRLELRMRRFTLQLSPRPAHPGLHGHNCSNCDFHWLCIHESCSEPQETECDQCVERHERQRLAAFRARQKRSGPR